MAAPVRDPGICGTRRFYRCFLVRCRLEERAGPEGQPVWRFTVLHGGDPARRSFTSLHDVVTHIEAELAAYGPTGEDPPNDRTP